MSDKIIELGNLYPPHGKWKSQQCGRVYSVKGIAPTLNTCGGAKRTQDTDMLRIALMREARTEHAKAVRRQTGTNDFRDKEIHLLDADVMACLGTSLTNDNLIVLEYG